MNSFSDYLDGRLREDVSREGQIAQYSKSLNSLYKVRKRLVANGMNTADIDNQMGQLQQAMSRRLSGVHKWYGDIVRIDQEPINKTPMWKLSTNGDLFFHIPVSDTAGVIKIPDNWHQFPSPYKPMTKFIEYRQEIVGYNMINLVTYAENRTVDVVPVRTHEESNQYFLIKRRDSGLWATVGGHIDEGELGNPIIAATRELKEETQAVPLVIRQLPSGWVKEIVSNPEETPSKEYNSWTLPYIAVIDPHFTMKASDDAAYGRWFDVGEVPSGFHFAHHHTILNKAFEFLPILLKQFGKHNKSIGGEK